VAFGPEEVRVPAGTFACIRVEEETDGFNRASTTWYTPGVGVLKTSRVASLTLGDPPRRIEAVLTSFSPGKD
jgi:hypothetical protein